MLNVRTFDYGLVVQLASVSFIRGKVTDGIARAYESHATLRGRWRLPKPEGVTPSCWR